MNLLQVRTKFKEISGRYDLVLEDGSDNGADFYINEAVKWLDKTVETTKSWASYMEIVAANTLYVQFPFCRAIKEVWAATSEGRWQLEKKRLQDLIAGYLTEPPAELTSGTPLYYAPALTRYIPEDMSAITFATFATYLETLTITDYTYNAILLNVPVSLTTLIDVRGLFFSIALEEDTDENYWSMVNPLLLVQAACKLVYTTSGNKPMLDITDRGLDGDLQRLEKDLVEQEIAEIDQMDG